MGSRRMSGAIVNTSLGALHVRTDGPTDGPVLVLIHGFAGSIHWFDRVVQFLESTHRVIRVDLFGHGCTGGNVHLDASAQAQAVVEMIVALDLTDITIAGHSFGSDVALHAARSTTAISRVVVIDQAPDLESANFPPGSSLMISRTCARLSRPLAFPALIRRIGRHAFADGFDPRTAFDNPNQMFDDFVAMSPDLYRTMLRDRRQRLRDKPLDALVRDLGKPVTAIHGRCDKLFDWESTLDRYYVAGARTVLLDGAGHSPNVESPLELSAELRSASHRSPACRRNR